MDKQTKENFLTILSIVIKEYHSIILKELDIDQEELKRRLLAANDQELQKLLEILLKGGKEND